MRVSAESLAGLGNETVPWWEQLINAGSGIATGVMKVYQTRNAVPQLAPGQSITQLRDGTYQVTQNANGIATGGSLSLGAGVGVGANTLLLAGLGVLAVMMLQRGKN